MTRDHAIDSLRADMDVARNIAGSLQASEIRVAAIQALGRMHQALALYFKSESELGVAQKSKDSFG